MQSTRILSHMCIHLLQKKLTVSTSTSYALSQMSRFCLLPRFTICFYSHTRYKPVFVASRQFPMNEVETIVSTPMCAPIRGERKRSLRLPQFWVESNASFTAKPLAWFDLQIIVVRLLTFRPFDSTPAHKRLFFFFFF